MFTRTLSRILIIVGLLAVGLYCAIKPKKYLGIDLQGGAELRYEVDASALPKGISPDQAAKQTLAVIQRRVDPDGTLQAEFRTLPGGGILVRIPGLDPERRETVKHTIEAQGRLEFHLVADENHDRKNYQLAREALEAGKPLPPRLSEQFQWFKMARTDEDVLVQIRDDYNVTGKYLRNVYRAVDEAGLPAVAFELDHKGAKRMRQLTQNRIGWRMAIILNSRLDSAPRINDVLSDSIRVTHAGGFSAKEQEFLITTLLSGSLPTSLILQSEDFVGPSMGKDSIDRGIFSLVVAFALIVLFMTVYYFFAGLIASFALFLNLLLVVAVLVLFKATITLPGLAGLLLTAGMSVDANVLIFERIREERAKGKVLRHALKNGYERAFVTIVDANITTIITALALYYVGTGEVQSFAMVLIVGILFSMFTAMVITRMIFNILLDTHLIRSVPMLQLIKKPSIRFVNLSRKAMVVSTIIIVAGMALFLTRGKKNLDIDLTSGIFLHLSLKETTDIELVRKRVREVGYPNAEIQARAKDANVVGRREAREYGIRIALTDPRRTRAIEKEITQAFEDLVETRQVKVKNIHWRVRLAPRVREDAPPFNWTAEVELDTLIPRETIEKGLKEAGLATFEVEVPSGDLDATELTRFTLNLVTDDKDMTHSVLLNAFQTPVPFVSTRFISPSEAQRMVRLAFWAILLSMGAIVVYIWIRFGKPKFGLAAVVALTHDVLFVLGAIALADAAGATVVGTALRLGSIKINLPVVAALMTIIGYSLNDTIVVFDRIRENMGKRRELHPDLIDRSINQTLSRTLLTSVTTLAVVLTLYIAGGARIHGFAFTLLIGVLVGTYSSIFIASPILIWTQLWQGKDQEFSEPKSAKATAI